MQIMLRIVILLFISTAAMAEAQDWLKYVRGLGFGERLAEIRTVSELPKTAQRDRVAALIHLLKDEDQSVRLAAAAEIAEIHDVSDQGWRMQTQSAITWRASGRERRPLR